MSTIKIVILPGDGIGKEVSNAILPVFDLLNLDTELKIADVGWDFWCSEGNPLPDRTIKLIKEADATILGAITSKPAQESQQELADEFKYKNYTYISPVIQLRQKLDLFANVRPCYNIKGGANDFNFCVIRENTEGLYSGFDFYPIDKNIKDLIDVNSKYNNMDETEIACSLRLQTATGLKRLFEYAFDYAKNNNFTKVTLADKPNVLRNSSNFARIIFEEVANKYKNIKAEILNVDAVALWMVRKPEQFGVIVAENMFGDILSDLGAGIMGGLGLAPSANIGNSGCYFEPVHGSAPNMPQGRANPSAMFLSVALMLNHLGYLAEARQINLAVTRVIREKKVVTYDLGGSSSTAQMSAAILKALTDSSNIRKSISLLSTGNEIITGEIVDSNSNLMSQKITKLGGSVYKIIQSSDSKQDIKSSMQHLLESSEAVIVTGGLGPTSDDNTRFAFGEVTKSDLIFNKEAWQHIQARLNKFNLQITDNNKQQALFPSSAELIKNTAGTAYGCYLEFSGKHLFMLPGPPKECFPMFDDFVVPKLSDLSFFEARCSYVWKTLGLIEGEISNKIEQLILKYDLSSVVNVGYRWNYPYVDIKISSNSTSGTFQQFLRDVDFLTEGFLISKDELTALQVLTETVLGSDVPISVIDNVTKGELELLIANKMIMFSKINSDYVFYINSHEDFNSDSLIRISLSGNSKDNEIFSHEMVIPNRGHDVIQFILAYATWQLSQFIKHVLEVECDGTVACRIN